MILGWILKISKKFFGHNVEPGPVNTIIRAAGNCLLNHSIKFPVGAPILNNPAFWHGSNNNKIIFSDQFLEDWLGLHDAQKYRLKWKDLTDPENNLLPLEPLREIFRYRISTDTYNKLKQGLNGAKKGQRM
jgi:hypothetical protein